MFAPDSWDRTQEGDQKLLTTRTSTSLLLVARLASSWLRALTSIPNHTHRKFATIIVDKQIRSTIYLTDKDPSPAEDPVLASSDRVQNLWNRKDFWVTGGHLCYNCIAREICLPKDWSKPNLMKSPPVAVSTVSALVFVLYAVKSRKCLSNYAMTKW